MKFASRNPKLDTQDLRKRLAMSSAIICGTIFLSSTQSALAERYDRPSMRDFRADHADLSRREARQLFKDTYNARSAPGASLPPVITPKLTNQISNLRNDNVARGAELTGKQIRLGIQDMGPKLVNLRNGVDLDLTSGDRNIVLGTNLFKDVSSVEINVGGATQTYTAGSQVTASEYVAIKQVLSGSNQNLTLDQSGIASGGTLDLTAITTNADPMRAANLTIASGVTTYGDFGKQSDFILKGDLNNYGSVVALTTRNSGNGGAIRADDITNQAGANIQSSVNLELAASGTLTNLGSINSTGNLTLTAASGIDNQGTVSADKTLTINTPTLANTSTIESINGDVNLNGPSTAALNITNNGGTIAALKGDINVRTPSYNGTFDNNITGGDFLSKNLNLYSGNAANNVVVNQLTGVLSQTGLAGHILTDTDNLVIGETCLTGDPTFYNFGDITINGNLSAAEALTIIATGNITMTNGVTIEARDATTGFDITFIAGANITNPLSGGGGTLPSGAVSGAVTIDGGPSANGGSITFGTGSVISTPTGLNGDGGDISLFAFKGASSTSGRIDVNSAAITSGGVGTGNNGNVLIVGGGSDSMALGTAIQIGQITTTGGSGGGGDLRVSTSQPNSTGGPVTYEANGLLAVGSPSLTDSTVTANASIGMSGGKATVSGDAYLYAGLNLIQQAAGDTLYMNNINKNVNLIAESGNIGGSGVGNAFVIEGFNELLSKKVLKKILNFDSGNSILTVTTGGTAFIVRNASTNLSLATSSADDRYELQTNSRLTVLGDITSADGQVSLTNTGGSFVMGANSSIIAEDTISITNATEKKYKPTFELGADSEIITEAGGTAGLGHIFLVLDPKALEVNSVGFANTGRRNIPTPTIAGQFVDLQSFAFMSVSATNGGTVSYTGKKPEGILPLNVVDTDGPQISIFNFVKKGAFFFGGNTRIEANQ